MLIANTVNFWPNVVATSANASRRSSAGHLLNTQRTTFQYSRVTMIVVSIFLVVLVLEQLSEAARRRLV